MAVRVAVPSPTRFKYIIQTLAKISDEGDYIFSRDEFTVYMMSLDKTNLAILRAPAEAFDEYDVSEETVLRVRNDDLAKIVARATRNDQLVFEYDESNGQLKVILEDKKTGVSRTFMLPVTRLDRREVREVKMEGKARFTLMAEDFKDVIQDARLVGEVLEIKASKDEVVATASGEEKEYEWVMKEGDPLVSLSVEEESASSYTLNSLIAITKPTGAAENVLVEFESNYPLRATFTFQNGEKLVIYVAPTLG